MNSKVERLIESELKRKTWKLTLDGIDSEVLKKLKNNIEECESIRELSLRNCSLLKLS